MDFEYSKKVTELRARLEAFMKKNVLPKEQAVFEEISSGDRWQPSKIVEELKIQAQDKLALMTI